MSQEDQNVANADGATVRADINAQLVALVTLSSGLTAPTTIRAYQWWLDTTASLLKQRNASNTAWVIRASADDDRVITKTANYTAVLADFGKLILAAASAVAVTITLPAAASAGNGFVIAIKAIDVTNVVTIDGNAAEIIDGATTLVLSNQHDSAVLRCDGSNWHVVAEKGGTSSDGEFRSVQVFIADGTYTKPAGLVRAVTEVVGGGGGGGGAAADQAAGAAGAGGYATEILEASAIGATETVTVGTGGAGGAAGANNGANGNTSSFGALSSATGGSSGAANGGAGTGGVGSGGTINAKGGAGQGSDEGTGSNIQGGGGGSSRWGGGGRGGASGAGSVGGNYGGGGGGASGNGSVARAGGNGADGIVIVWEYF